MMVKTIPLAQVSLAEMAEEMRKTPIRWTITDRGEPLMLIWRPDDYLGLLAGLKHQIQRADYVRMLIEEGKTGAELRRLMAHFDESDKRLREGPERFHREVEEFARNKFREYCEGQGIDYDTLTEERVAAIIDDLVSRVRDRHGEKAA